MIPLGVTLEGFLSYQDPRRLEFDGSPLWVLAGPNGAGKSAIFDAITYALYDYHRAGGQNAGDLINHHRDRLVVEFDFLLDGAAYRVRRTARKRGRSVDTTREAFRLLPSDTGDPARPDGIPDTTSDAGFRQWVKATIGLDYPAFTSSVLLLQGQSDRLLRATTADRYRILAEIIDLTPYQALHCRVEDGRRRWEGQARSLRSQLASMPPIGEADLEAALAALRRAEDQWEALQAKSERLAAVLEQARQWEGLEQERAKLQGELDKAAGLLDRGAEIDDGFARWQELDRIVPQIQSILKQRGRLAEHAGVAEKLRSDIVRGEEQLTEARTAQATAQSVVEHQAEEIRKQQEERAQVATRLAEIGPLVAKLDQFEAIQSRLEENANALALLPADPEGLIAQAQERDRLLQEAALAHPWLKQLDSARRSLSKAREQEQSAASGLDKTRTRLSLCREEREPAAAAANSAAIDEKRLDHALTRAQTSLDELRGRRDRFETVAGENTCSFCGQPIDERHAKRERKLLADQVATATGELQDLRTAHQTAVEELKHREKELHALDQEIGTLDKQVSEWERCRKAAQEAARQYHAQISDAFQNLPAAYQALVASQVPEAQQDWLATVYPTAADLTTLKREADERPAVGQHLSKLRDQQRQWQRLDAEREGFLGQQREIQATLDLSAARAARDEQEHLKLRATPLEKAVQRLHEAQRQAAKVLQDAEEAVKGRQTENARLGTKAAQNQATCDEIGRALKATIAALPQAWQEKAAAFGAAEMALQESTLTQLKPYAELSRQLDAARRDKDGLEKRFGELIEQIKALPEEAKYPAATVEAQLAQSRGERDAADAARRKAEQSHGDLERQREQRRQCEVRHLQADRQRHLHDRLATLLGPRGLQLSLLRRAERGIVTLANETLSALSRGRMELALRGDDGLEDSSSDKALDLVVYNHDTGTRPMLAALASGSQAFRIAVSLALAIGRYAGQEARRIESVIIDEGFGGLDKDGRDDMIQELHQLTQQLKRIILVSHQEEFAGAFANGYAVKLSADGASRVSLLECG